MGSERLPSSGQLPLSIEDIYEMISHRRPFMFLDSAQIVIPGREAIGKLTDLTHPDFAFLEGHFPEFPVVPGAIIMEVLAELLGVAVGSGVELENRKNSIGILTEETMRYRQKIKAEDSVWLWARVIGERNFGTSNFVMGEVQAWLEDKLGDKIAAEGKITFAIIDNPDLSFE